MKKITSLILAVCLTLTIGTYATATTFDLSGMSYADLVALKDQINIAMWECQEWQEVEVPQGVWEVGKDIPVGHWTIKCAGESYTCINLGTVLDESGHDIDVWNSRFYFGDMIYNPNSRSFDPDSDKASIDFDLKMGTFVIIDNASAIFTPYSGKPNLGFK